MTGSWDDPKVESIARQVADKNPTIPGQPSPNYPPQTAPQPSPPAQQQEVN